MKIVNFNVGCYAIYNSELGIPDDIAEDKEKVLNYIRDHLGDCSVSDIEWVGDLDPFEAVTKDDIRYIC